MSTNYFNRLIYRILHFFVGRIIIPLFIKQLNITGLHNVPASGPVLLAATHPNSFFDAMLINVLLKRPVWSLARGDVFAKPWAAQLLSTLKMLPIYRLSEGKENLGKNDATFDGVQQLWKQNEVVLIFSEGLCTNQQELLPLKKGTSRLVQTAWQQGTPVAIVPIGLTYNHFGSFRKQVNMHVGEAIQPTDFQHLATDSGAFIRQFNELLKQRLEGLLSWQFPPTSFQQNPIYYVGWLVNFPVYWLASSSSRWLTKGTVHADAVMAGLLTVLLPLYWLLLAQWIF